MLIRFPILFDTVLHIHCTCFWRMIEAMLDPYCPPSQGPWLPHGCLQPLPVCGPHLCTDQFPQQPPSCLLNTVCGQHLLALQQIWKNDMIPMALSCIMYSFLSSSRVIVPDFPLLKIQQDNISSWCGLSACSQRHLLSNGKPSSSLSWDMMWVGKQHVVVFKVRQLVNLYIM